MHNLLFIEISAHDNVKYIDIYTTGDASAMVMCQTVAKFSLLLPLPQCTAEVMRVLMCCLHLLSLRSCGISVGLVNLYFLYICQIRKHSTFFIYASHSRENIPLQLAIFLCTFLYKSEQRKYNLSAVGWLVSAFKNKQKLRTAVLEGSWIDT